MRILVLEDEPLIQMALVDTLQDAGHKVASTETAAGAQAIATLDTIDIAILDLNLGSGQPDGCVAARAIREVRPGCRIIFLTAHVDEFSIHRMRQAGADVVMSKPMSDQTLFEVIKAFEDTAVSA